MMSNRISDFPVIVQDNEFTSQSSDKSQRLSIFSEQILDVPKKQLHPILLAANIFWMLFCCHCNLYYVYGPGKEMQKKGQVAGVALGLTVFIGVPTFFYLISFKELVRLAIIFDTIMVVTVAAGLAFINLILFFDNSDDWFWTVIQAGFTIQLIFCSTMVRVFLVHLKWSKWKIIAFKLSAMTNCLMFLVSGVYFIFVDFSYTQHLLVVFDQKVHDFMLLFMFSLFSYTYEIYSKISDLDHTGDLKYTYLVKNYDTTLTKKTKSIINKKRQSINSINILRKSQLVKDPRQFRLSKFVQPQNLQ